MAYLSDAFTGAGEYSVIKRPSMSSIKHLLSEFELDCLCISMSEFELDCPCIPTRLETRESERGEETLELEGLAEPWTSGLNPESGPAHGLTVGHGHMKARWSAKEYACAVSVCTTRTFQ